MEVLGISGTLRKNGNSEILLNRALGPFLERDWKASILRLSERQVSPCLGCEACGNDGSCVQHDDMAQFYEAFSRCDALIIATPVHFRNISASLMAVFGRHHACNRSKPLRNKPGGAIAVGRSTGGGGQSIAISIVYNWLLSCGAVCVPGELNGVTASANKAGDILSQENRLLQARVLGQNVLDIAEKLRKTR